MRTKTSVATAAGIWAAQPRERRGIAIAADASFAPTFRMNVSALAAPWGEASLIADPRIDEGVEQIDDEIDQGEQSGRNHHCRLNHGEVEIGDRIQNQLAHAGP